MRMKKRWKVRVASLLLAVLLMTSLSVGALAAEDGGLGLDYETMPYPVAAIGYQATNFVFEAANLLAGAVEPWSESDGQCLSNLKYGDGARHVYDLYVPAGLDPEKEQGLVLFIHGGTWSMGNKDHMRGLCRKIAKKGYITATMNYDLASYGNPELADATGSMHDANVIDMVDDVQACVSAMKQKLGELGYKISGLALSGESAGSNISMLYGYGRADQSAIPVKLIFNITSPVGFYNGTFDNYTTAEVAEYASLVSGETLTAEDIENPDARADAILASISPVKHITYGSVPTLMAFAGKDTTIGTNQYNTIKPVLDQYGVPNDVVWLPNSDHTLAADPGKMDEWIETSAQWLDRYVGTGKQISIGEFSDVPSNAWYAEAVSYVAAKGLMAGTSATTFGPHTAVTRAMTAQILYAMDGRPAVSMRSGFSDDSGSAWYSSALAYCRQNKLAGGFEDNTFRPDSPVTREQLAVMLHAFASSRGMDTSEKSSLNRFEDRNAVSSWAEDAVKWCVGNSLMGGRDNGCLDPGATATRAEMAQMLKVFCEKTNK